MTAFLVACAFLAAPQSEVDAAPLPVDWHGDWRGLLMVSKGFDKPMEIMTSLTIKPIKDSKATTWVLTYGSGKSKQVRNYEISPKGMDYEIDEKNGIRLIARLFDGKLTTMFRAGENYLQTSYELSGETLTMETLTFAVDKPLETKVELAEVVSYRPSGRQIAVMKRAEKK